jgi:hypothetical protein
MPDDMEAYLDEVMHHARLAPQDAQRVREELTDHLHELAALLPPGVRNTKEAAIMFGKEFGDPRELGQSISRSRGRLRTVFKKHARRLPIAIAAVIVLAFTVRATVAEAFYVAGNSVSPVLTHGSRCIVYKLSSTYWPQDVIVYQPAENAGLRFLAIVESTDPATGDLHVTRNNGTTLTVPRQSVIGRVVLSTR